MNTSPLSSVFLDPYSVDFSRFVGREAGISAVYRYKIYPECWYRSNLAQHSLRVLYLLQASLPKILKVFPEVDTRRMQLLCLVHDDAEIFTGDFPSVNSVKMSAEELATMDEHEERTIDHMASLYPANLMGYGYADLLREILRKETVEAQVVKFFDHLDAFGEALHEIYAGNPCFVTKPRTEYGEMPIAVDYYIPKFANSRKNYPLLTALIDEEIPFASRFEREDFEAAAAAGRPHTPENILEPSGYPLYDWWKRIIWETGDESARRCLTQLSERVRLA
jgi:5'-deoxynucleotidase YfbR-like HD superfamily hydrolase